MNRPTPPEAVLELKRQYAGASPEHSWAWCSNPDCDQILWFHPRDAEPFERKGATFMPVCSPKCAVAAGLKLRQARA